MNHRRRVGMCLGLVLAIAGITSAADTRTYSGVVTDPQGKPLAGVRVWSSVISYDPDQAKSSEGETKTDEQGRYSLGPVPAIVEPMPRSRAFTRRMLWFEHPDFAIGWRQLRGDGSRFGEDDSQPQSVALRPGADVRVHVVDGASEKPVAGAQVEIQVGDFGEPGGGLGTAEFPQPPAVVRTDAKGDATFARMPATAGVVMTVTHPAYARYQSEAGRRRPTETSIKPGGPPVLVKLEPGGSIRVHATPLEGKPALRSAELRAEAADAPEGNQYTQAVFDEHGDFLLAGLRPGQYNLMFTPLTAADDTGGVWAPLRDVKVEPGQTTDAKLVQVPGQLITGRLIDSRSHLPAVGHPVFAVLSDGQRQFTFDGGVSKDDGTFRVRAVPGEYTLRAATFTQRSENAEAVDRKLTLAADAPASVGDIEVQTWDYVRARLVDASGKAVTGHVTNAMDTVKTAADGAFALRTGPAAMQRYVLAFSDDQVLGKVLLPDESMTDPKLAAAGAQLPTIQLKATASVSGRVVDLDGKVITDAEMGLFPRPVPGRVTTVSSLGGFRQEPEKFVFSAVPTGLPLQIMVTRANALQSVALDDLAPGEVRELPDVTLSLHIDKPDATKALAGRVVDEQGNPVADVHVQAMPERPTAAFNGLRPIVASTDRDGRFILKDVPSDMGMRIIASAEGYQRQQNVVADVGAKEVSIKLTRLGGALIGKAAPELVIDSWIAGQPVKLADLRGKVVLLHLNASILSYAQSGRTLIDAAGKYSEKGLVVVAVSRYPRTNGDTVEQLADEAKRLELPFAVGIDKPRMIRSSTGREIPSTGLTDRAYGMDQATAIILIDKKGIVRAATRSGNLDEEIEKRLAE